jgi:sirohydrochlorin ferrochelatase
MTHPTAPLVLAAHGSAHPGFATVIESLASTVARTRPGIDVQIGYLEHGFPRLPDVAGPGCIVVPVLLTNGYHAHIDIPSQAPGARITRPIGPDPRLAMVMAERLRATGWHGEQPVVLAGAGSADAEALDDVRQMAAALGGELGMTATAAFVTSGEPALHAVEAAAVVPYLIAPGHYADLIGRQSATFVSPAIGNHPVLAQIVLERYDAEVDTNVGPPEAMSLGQLEPDGAGRPSADSSRLATRSQVNNAERSFAR